MPKKIIYSLKILDKLTKEISLSTKIDGTAIQVVDEINRYYNCEMISKHIVNNIICRRDKVNTKYNNIYIEKT